VEPIKIPVLACDWWKSSFLKNGGSLTRKYLKLVKQMGNAPNNGMPKGMLNNSNESKLVSLKFLFDCFV
jgi:hypothetical protein